ncbi:MAG: GTPase ObgE [Nitrospinae bacterium]|nr:GTPase ObgE [Nitrospinota bacterium]
MNDFIDRVRINIKAGDGGAGSASFRREKFAPMGGPDGGDGGNGGSIIFVADHNLGTLLDFTYHRHFGAEDGERGGKRQMSGKSGDDLTLKVPVGTMLLDAQTGEQIADLDRDGKSIVAAKGGKGGWGNVHFKSSINQAPRRANPGTDGEKRMIVLELKLIADVGILGYPNAGKSTLISRISAAKPKIADYPFTTITPNLGVVEWLEGKTYVVADIPGLIEGAAEGRGLGHQFLRHVERTKLLLHLIDPVAVEEGRDPVADFKAINAELVKYSPDLAVKSQIVAISKMDAVTDKAGLKKAVKKLSKASGGEVFTISAVSGEGIDDLKKLIGRRLLEMKEAQIVEDIQKEEQDDF